MDILKQKRKVVLCIFMSLIMTASTVATVNADSNSFMTGYSGQYGEPFAEVSRGLYTYKLHENEKKGTVIYTGEFLTHVIWHQYGQAIITYLRLRDEGFSFDSAKSWNEIIGGSIGSSKNISVAAEKGLGTIAGWDVSAEYIRQCSLDEKAMKKAVTGYYSLAAGKPSYKIHWKKYNRITDNMKCEGAFYMPSGQTGIFLVRSLDHQETWTVY